MLSGQALLVTLSLIVTKPVYICNISLRCLGAYPREVSQWLVSQAHTLALPGFAPRTVCFRPNNPAFCTSCPRFHTDSSLSTCSTYRARSLSGKRTFSWRLTLGASILSNIYPTFLGHVGDGSCSNDANIWFIIHPTFLGDTGRTLCGVGRGFFRRCQHFIQYSPKNFRPCWDDVVWCWNWMIAVQPVSTFDPTFIQHFWAM